MQLTKKTFILLSLIFFSCTVNGWGNDPGSTGSAFLRIPVGARASSMGEAFTPLANDITAVYWNPAGISQLNRHQLSATHSEWFGGLRHNFLGYGTPLTHKDNIGVFASAFYAQDFEERIGPSDIPSGEFSSTQAVAGLTYSRKINDFFRAGVTLKGIYESIADETASTVAADLGLLYHIPSTNFQLALTARHLGPGITFVDEKSDLPITVGGGLAWSLINGNIITVAQVEKPIDLGASFAFGIEAKPVESLKTRVGYNFNDDRDNQGGIAGFTLGIGFEVQEMYVDYAFVPYGDLGDTHRFSVTFDIGNPISPVISKTKTTPEELKIIEITKPEPMEEKEETIITEKSIPLQAETETFPVSRKPPTLPRKISIAPQSIVVMAPPVKTPLETIEEQIEFVESTQIAIDKDTTQIPISHVVKLTEEDLTPAELAKIHYDTGVAYHKKGDFDKAIEHYLKAIEIDRYMPEPHSNLGIIYIRLGNIEQGRIELRKGIELEKYH